jgi:aminomethyltransferase
MQSEMHSPLLEIHESLAAKMGDFAGWQMPLEYPAPVGGGTLAEHEAVRERVGIFDVSHLGKISIVGTGAKAWANEIFTNDVERSTAGQAQYSLLCTPDGGVIDDVIMYCQSEDALFVVPNAANAGSVFDVLQSKNSGGLEIVNRHQEFAVIALQGPLSTKVLNAVGLAQTLTYMSFAEVTFNGATFTLCRTGYSGEHGYELIPPSAVAVDLWNALSREVLALDGRIAGLGARDTLRTEMGYPLHGHELSLEISPLEANLSWAIGWRKRSFIGHEALRAQQAKGVDRLLRGLQLTERGIPRAGMMVRNGVGAAVGEITSGTFSPTLKVGIALALIESGIEVGEPLVIDVRGRSLGAVVTKPPFVPSRVRD